MQAPSSARSISATLSKSICSASAFASALTTHLLLATDHASKHLSEADESRGFQLVERLGAAEVETSSLAALLIFAGEADHYAPSPFRRSVRAACVTIRRPATFTLRKTPKRIS